MSNTYFRRRSFISSKVIWSMVIILMLSASIFTLSINSDTKSAYAASDENIMGTPKVSAIKMAAYYRWKQAKSFPGRPFRATVSLDELARLFIEEGIAEGVRGDIAFAQAIHESLWFNFPDYGQVKWTDNNYAGIGACNSCANGFYYPSARIGVRAQIQLLRNYADSKSRISNLAYPPVRASFDVFKFKGAAPTWSGLNGKWAVPGTTYGQSILNLYNGMASHAGVSSNCLADTQALSAQTSGSGYWTVNIDGVVTAFGNAVHYGNVNDPQSRGKAVSIVATPTKKGYWIMTTEGFVYPFGDAKHFGDSRIHRGRPFIDMAASPSGKGYLIFSSDGGVLRYGDAQYYGDARGHLRVMPIESMAMSPTGKGYLLLGRDGSILRYGDAPYFGNARSATEKRWTVGLSINPNGKGYRIISRYGDVYSFGEATSLGELSNCVGQNVKEIVSSSTGNGYLLVTYSGRVVSTGDAKHFSYRNTPTVDIAAT